MTVIQSNIGLSGYLELTTPKEEIDEEPIAPT